MIISYTYTIGLVSFSSLCTYTLKDSCPIVHHVLKGLVIDHYTTLRISSSWFSLPFLFLLTFLTLPFFFFPFHQRSLIFPLQSSSFSLFSSLRHTRASISTFSTFCFYTFLFLSFA
uniref:Uncharacterized protein n=1 Tax=Cacopsylla melanoneura TaxID=428564 RepID=A0A8D9A5F6_9HEMI